MLTTLLHNYCRFQANPAATNAIPMFQTKPAAKLHVCVKQSLQRNSFLSSKVCSGMVCVMRGINLQQTCSFQAKAAHPRCRNQGMASVSLLEATCFWVHGGSSRKRLKSAVLLRSNRELNPRRKAGLRLGRKKSPQGHLSDSFLQSTSRFSYRSQMYRLPGKPLIEAN